MRRSVIVLVLLFLINISISPENVEAATPAPYQVSVSAGTILYQFSGKTLIPKTTLKSTKIFRAVTTSGAYYRLVDGRTTWYVRKQDGRLISTNLSLTAIADSANTRLIHEYMRTLTRGHIPYYYDELKDSTAIARADAAIKGNWYIPSPPHQLRVPNIDTYRFDKYVPNVDSNSFKFQIHYFTTLNQLTQAYAATGQDEYLRYGKRIISSWTKQYPISAYTRHPWPYHDHGTAIRTFHLLNFWNVFRTSRVNTDPAFSQLFAKTLYEHATLLAKTSFYKPNNNHGIFQDMALSAVAETHRSFDRSAAWRGLATTRLTRQLNHSLSADGVHLEHSPYYQIYLYDTLARFNDWASANRFELSSRMRDVKDMPVALTYMLKPNGTLPMFGDTPSITHRTNAIPYIERYPHLLYAMTGGKAGVQPTVKAGRLSNQYAFFRQHWGGRSGPFQDAVQVTMTAGYHSNIHKHADDLSIDLYGYGRDFLVESGRYAYTKRPERNVVLQAAAHNTVHVAGQSFRLIPSNLRRSQITSVGTSSIQWTASGTSQLIGNGMSHTRRLAYDRDGTVLVYDRVTSPVTESFVQRFHLGVGLHRVASGSRYAYFKDAAGRSLHLLQLEVGSIPKLAVGSSHVSYRDYDWQQRNQVATTKRGKGVTYLTLLHIGEKPTKISSYKMETTSRHYIVRYTLSDGTTKTLSMLR
ncbi:heparinase II/III family protein [Exiguobacterium sp. SH0S2]|uniref:heparinase II/III family protein n=1 Tax=Exiguobacterium sp. SH0S2 TaxID=2510950 RepID=UPI00103D648C|nr:heparinase II/III family protein [Exiguobacterium sp. SH0S2]TCI60501.1 heparinase [Exiguobacterium sp. SH0S2]